MASSYFGMEMSGSTAKIAEAAQQAQKMNVLNAYLVEIQNLPIATLLSCFIIYFIGGYFYTVHFMLLLVQQ